MTKFKTKHKAFALTKMRAAALIIAALLTLALLFTGCKQAGSNGGGNSGSTGNSGNSGGGGTPPAPPEYTVVAYGENGDGLKNYLQSLAGEPETVHKIEVRGFSPDDLTSAFYGHISPFAEIIQESGKKIALKLPADLTKIGDWAFSNCMGLTSIDLSACTNLTGIGEYAFYGCTGLTSLDLSACTSLTGMGSAAFQECTSLEQIKLPENITYISATSFKKCIGLTKLDLSRYTSLRTIEAGAFGDCTSLRELSLPQSLKRIGLFDGGSGSSTTYGAFINCTSLTSIDLSPCRDLQEIDQYSFKGCTLLTNAVFANTTGWAVYSNFTGQNKYTDINSADLGDPATAAKYLRENTNNGGYCDKYWWKKN